jgi:[citrate (pro-3S)-lyase] ligase
MLIANILPKTTMDFIKENMAVLQDRIKKGQKIHGN